MLLRPKVQAVTNRYGIFRICDSTDSVSKNVAERERKKRNRENDKEGKKGKRVKIREVVRYRVRDQGVENTTNLNIALPSSM